MEIEKVPKMESATIILASFHISKMHVEEPTASNATQPMFLELQSPNFLNNPPVHTAKFHIWKKHHIWILPRSLIRVLLGRAPKPLTFQEKTFIWKLKCHFPLSYSSLPPLFPRNSANFLTPYYIPFACCPLLNESGYTIFFFLKAVTGS